MSEKNIDGLKLIFHSSEENASKQIGNHLFGLALKMIEDGRMNVDDELKEKLKQLKFKKLNEVKDNAGLFRTS